MKTVSESKELLETLPRTTAIGSLPHHNIDAALAFSFQLGIPFLPQIPIRNPWEYMVAQALEGLPGLRVETDGSTLLNRELWESRTHAFGTKLAEAFENADREPKAFEAFEPSSATASCWQPFLWELEERESKLAKIQIAGPMTAQWVLKLTDGTPADRAPELASQIYRLVLARTLAMVRRLKAIGVQPLVFLDEPALFAYSGGNPRHMLAMQELRLMLATLGKEGAWVGLHCCSDTDWDTVLGLPLDFVSLDTHLSLSGFLAPARLPKLQAFIERGGRLSLGAIPTTVHPSLGPSLGIGMALDSRKLAADLLDTFAGRMGSKPALVKKILREALYTPACGLALHDIGDAELILGALRDFYGYLRSELHLT